MIQLLDCFYSPSTKVIEKNKYFMLNN